MNLNRVRSVTRTLILSVLTTVTAASHAAPAISARGAAPRASVPVGRAAMRPAAMYVASADDNVVLQWDNALLQTIREVKPGPTVVSRAIGILHTAMFDAWAAYDDVAVGTRLGGSLRRPEAERTRENKEEAISYAAYRALSDLFPVPSQVAHYDALMFRLGYDPGIVSTDPEIPSGIGNRAAAALLEFRHRDGSNQLGDLHPGAYSDTSGYRPVNTPDRIVDPNRWQPLRIPDGHGGYTVQTFTTPHWGNVVPFSMQSGHDLTPATLPYMYTLRHFGSRMDLAQTRAYIEQAQQLVEISANLTDEQKMIAEYWADGPSSEFPPGHWCLIGQYVSRRDGHSLDEDVQMFFALGNAVMDAGIAAWDCKRAFDYVRPVTAIRFLYHKRWIRAWAGPYKGTRWIRGEDWQPYQAPNVVTPPFAECVSGHSTFSAAAAEVLKRFTGSDAYGGTVVFPAGSSSFESGMVPARDVTLRWATFSDAADEAGLSRLYGGIHFTNGDLPGRAIGRTVGGLVWDRALTYIQGTAAG